MIETADRPVHSKSSSDREFGVVFAIVFFVIACWPLLSDGAFRLWALVVALVFFALAVFVPHLLSPANRLWAKFGTLLHGIVGPIALGILFYLVVTPTGLLMRLFGKNLLRLRFDPAVDSYWIRRMPPGPDAGSLNNQF